MSHGLRFKIQEFLIIILKWYCYYYLWFLQLPGLISVSAKFVPTIMNLLKNLAQQGEAPPAANPENRHSTNNASLSEAEHKSATKKD